MKADALKDIERWSMALDFAWQKHAGQARGDEPYVLHPIRVAECLRRIGNESDMDVLCAAVLHDTMECSDTTFDDIADRFGNTAATLVAELTKDSRLPDAQRREQMLAHISDLSQAARRIKLADKLDNLCDLLRGTKREANVSRYLDETRAVLAACIGACGPLECELSDAIEKVQFKFRDSQAGV